MNDYKELIENLREMTERGTGCEFDVTMLHCVENAADAIEQLVKERDAAVKELKGKSDCYTCANDEYCHSLKSNEPNICCGKYQWRGAQK